MAINNITGAQSIIQPAVCTSTTRPASPYVGQVIFETDTSRLKVYLGSVSGWSTGTLHSSTFNAEVLVVAGGGGGGTGQNGLSRYQGGGGAGGYRFNNAMTLSKGVTYIVTIGAGGNAGALGGGDGTAGNLSLFDTYQASGGGFGNWGNGDGIAAGSGGSGGGGGGNSDFQAGAGNVGGYTPVEGYAGGNGSTGAPYYGGGGGGAGGAGGTTGAGGVGVANTITGSSVTYATGGAGTIAGAGTAGPANTGNGGSAGSQNSSSFRGGAGGSGVVVIAYLNTNSVAASTSGSPTYSSSSRPGYHVYTFASTGTITF